MASHWPPTSYYDSLETNYQIPQTVFDVPSNRRVRIINIGTGLNSINNAYHIQKHCSNFELVMYDRNPSLGGTWLVNRYPNVACDVPSHVYQFSWALNPDWPRFFSYASEITAYFENVCDVFDLKKYMNFNTDIYHAEWMDLEGQWKLKCRETAPDGTILREFEDFADILLNNCGIQNDWKWPNIEGLDVFKGKLLHTARWDPEYQAEQWKGQSVAVIGGGASSVQTVPGMQPHVKHMDVFVRTGVWFVGLGSEAGDNVEYTTGDKQKFRDGNALVAHGKEIEHNLNGLFPAFYRKTEEQAKQQKNFADRMAKLIKDKRLLDGFTPKFQLGCRRVTPGDPYIKAIQTPNVDVHFTSVTRLTEDGVVGADGIERKVDAVICATGFDVAYKPRFPIIGRNGIDLRNKWVVHPDSYMGISCPGFPNYFFSSGPYWPVANGSLIGASNASAMYVCQVIRKLQLQPNIKSLCPSQAMTDRFAQHCQQWYKHTVWSDHCPSWYKNPRTGRVQSVWPGITLHHARVMRVPRWEDFEFAYKLNETGIEDNPFSYLGMGWVPEMFEEGADDSPHMAVGNIDPLWAASKGIRCGDRREALPVEEEKVANGHALVNGDALVNGNGVVKDRPLTNGNGHELTNGNAHVNGEALTNGHVVASGDEIAQEKKATILKESMIVSVNGLANGDGHVTV